MIHTAATGTVNGSRQRRDLPSRDLAWRGLGITSAGNRHLAEFSIGSTTDHFPASLVPTRSLTAAHHRSTSRRQEAGPPGPVKQSAVPTAGAPLRLDFPPWPLLGGPPRRSACAADDLYRTTVNWRPAQAGGGLAARPAAARPTVCGRDRAAGGGGGLQPWRAGAVPFAACIRRRVAGRHTAVGGPTCSRVRACRAASGAAHRSLPAPASHPFRLPPAASGGEPSARAGPPGA